MLNYTLNKNIVIEARESCRVPVPVERCPLFELDQQQIDDELDHSCKTILLVRFFSQRGFFWLILLFSSSAGIAFHVVRSESERTQRICSKHISESVQLKWSLLGADIKGTASLRGILLSSTMLSIITVAPLKWSMYPMVLF